MLECRAKPREWGQEGREEEVQKIGQMRERVEG